MRYDQNRWFDVRKLLVLAILLLCNSGCALVTYGVTDYPEHELELSMNYDGSCEGTINAVGHGPITYAGRVSIAPTVMEQDSRFSLLSRSINIYCDIDKVKSYREFAASLVVTVYIEDFIENFMSDYFGDNIVDPAANMNSASSRETRHFQLKQEELVLEVSKASNVNKLAPYQTNKLFPSPYVATIVATSIGDKFERPFSAKVLCSQSSLYSKNGRITINPTDEYRLDGVYATVTAKMVIGGRRCI